MSLSLPGYDAWKLATPPEYDEPEEREEQDPDDARDAAQDDAFYFGDAEDWQ